MHLLSMLSLFDYKTSKLNKDNSAIKAYVYDTFFKR